MRQAQTAAVVGSGPNGLAAAVTLARAGVPVTVFEAAETIGGGTRTSEVVQSGVLHDNCSAIHPLALSSPFFRAFELERRMSFSVPEVSYANPLDGGTAALAYRDLGRTVESLGRDGAAYRRFYRPILGRLDGVVDFALGGSVLRRPSNVSAAMTAALRAVEQGGPLWNLRFREEAAPALLSGAAAHTVSPMPAPASAAAGVLLGALGHARGWPVPVGGSRRISEVLAEDLVRHGGTIETAHPIDDARDLRGFGALLFDTSARGLARIAGHRLPPGYRRALERFSYGNGATKVDFVLDGPIPWEDPRVAATATVHVGGTRPEIAAAAREVARGRHPERPYVLLAQPTGFDPCRNPVGSNAVWSYTHVPRGSRVDVRERVIGQVERFAPGFRDRIVAVHQTTAGELSVYNRNYVGGDFSSGAVRIGQLIARPVPRTDPWRSPTPGIYLASSSASPGPGVHGLAGWYAALSALRNEFGLPAPHVGLDS